MGKDDDVDKGEVTGTDTATGPKGETAEHASTTPPDADSLPEPAPPSTTTGGTTPSTGATTPSSTGTSPSTGNLGSAGTAGGTG